MIFQAQPVARSHKLPHCLTAVGIMSTRQKLGTWTIAPTWTPVTPEPRGDRVPIKQRAEVNAGSKPNPRPQSGPGEQQVSPFCFQTPTAPRCVARSPKLECSQLRPPLGSCAHLRIR